jgi:hypothetical protein
MVQLKDSNDREQFETGAVRDVSDDKPALELISPIFEQRLGLWLQLGAKKYDRRNWEKGIPVERSLASLKRHLNAFQEGKTDEDHLAAIACNIMFIIHTDEMIKRGILPAELAYNPKYGADNE